MPSDLDILCSVDLKRAIVSLSCPQEGGLFAREAQLSAWLNSAGHLDRIPLSLKDGAPVNVAGAELPFAGWEGQEFGIRAGHTGLEGSLRVAQDTERRFIALQVRLENHSRAPVEVRRIVLFDAGWGTGGRGKLAFGEAGVSHDLAFLSNGWQSWSYTAVYGAEECQRRSQLWFIPNAASVNPATPVPRRRGCFTGEFFGVLGSRGARVGLLAGFLSQKEQFGTLEVELRSSPALRVWAGGDDVLLPPGGRLQTDWLLFSWLRLDDPQALQPYFRLVGAHHAIRPIAATPVGWCSWYQFYTGVDAEKIVANTRQLAQLQAELPLGLLQIDDGFQAASGDWLASSAGFPEGVAPLARLIHREGLKPGLWLAPFIVSRGAQLAKKRPDYLLRNRLGFPVNAGFISNRFAMALDISYPPALEYACQVVEKAAVEWGFDYLKLDFLYAGVLPGQPHNRMLTRAQALRNALQRVRLAAGPTVTLLGCGLPLGTGLGLVDAMRIGADTGGTWRPKLFGIPLFKNDSQLPCTRNAVQNTLTRAGMHRNWWINDPDCLLVREETALTEEEIHSHATLIGMSGGSLLLSDDLPQLSAARRRIIACLLPPPGKRSQVLDWFDRHTPQLLRLDLESAAGRWHLLAYFNWEDEPQLVTLEAGAFGIPDLTYRVRSFWDGLNVLALQGAPLYQQTIVRHGVALLAVRPALPEIQYIGSDLHFSQGLELAHWETRGDQTTLRLSLDRIARGAIDVYSPHRALMAFAHGAPVAVQALDDQVYRVAVQVLGALDLILVPNGSASLSILRGAS